MSGRLRRGAAGDGRRSPRPPVPAARGLLSAAVVGVGSAGGVPAVGAPEALYGGAAGGGKTAGLLMAALQFVDTPGYAALLLRRTYDEFEQEGSLYPRSEGVAVGSAAGGAADVERLPPPVDVPEPGDDPVRSLPVRARQVPVSVGRLPVRRLRRANPLHRGHLHVHRFLPPPPPDGSRGSRIADQGEGGGEPGRGRAWVGEAAAGRPADA